MGIVGVAAASYEADVALAGACRLAADTVLQATRDRVSEADCMSHYVQRLVPSGAGLSLTVSSEQTWRGHSEWIRAWDDELQDARKHWVLARERLVGACDIGGMGGMGSDLVGSVGVGVGVGTGTVADEAAAERQRVERQSLAHAQRQRRQLLLEGNFGAGS
jgi:hypothetical protein